MKKILFVFGAGGILGKGVSQILSNKNYDTVYLFNSRPVELPSPNSIYVQTSDLSNEENVIAAFSKINFEKNTEYFLLSSIGGYTGGKGVIDTSVEEWSKMMNMNVTVGFLITKHFFKNAQNCNGGAVCLTSAMTSFVPEENKAAYGTSKNALNFLVKTLAKEGKNYGISVNAIAPSVLDSKSNREWITDNSMMITPEAIGELVFSLFQNRKIVSGNILELPWTLNT